MNIFTISLIAIAILQSVVILFFINKGIKKENTEINLSELLDDIDFNKNIFFALIDENIEKFDIEDVENFLSLDSRLMEKIKMNKVKRTSIEKYNEFIVSSFETIGTTYFNLTDAKNFIKDLMYT